jgi:hypothetical protein
MKMKIEDNKNANNETRLSIPSICKVLLIILLTQINQNLNLKQNQILINHHYFNHETNTSTKSTS